MHRRTMIRSTVGIAAGTALAGCLGLGGGSTGTLATRVSDQPGDISDFSECVVTIDEIRVKPAESDGEETIDAGGATADLVKLQGDSSKLVTEESLATGEYEYLKLLVSDVDATLEGGGDTTVETPGDAPLKFNAQFRIEEGKRTTFVADFTPVKQGARNRYVLQPVADEVEVIHETPTSTES